VTVRGMTVCLVFSAIFAAIFFRYHSVGYKSALAGVLLLLLLRLVGRLCLCLVTTLISLLFSSLLLAISSTCDMLLLPLVKSLFHLSAVTAILETAIIRHFSSGFSHALLLFSSKRNGKDIKKSFSIFIGCSGRGSVARAKWNKKTILTTYGFMESFACCGFVLCFFQRLMDMGFILRICKGDRIGLKWNISDPGQGVTIDCYSYYFTFALYLLYWVC